MSALTSPLVGNVFGRRVDWVVGSAGVLELLDLHFYGMRVERRGRFGPSSGVVVVVGNDTGNSSDATCSVTSEGGLSRGWVSPSVQLRFKKQWGAAQLGMVVSTYTFYVRADG